MRSIFAVLVGLIGVSSAQGCSGGSSNACNVELQTGCNSGLVCESVVGGMPGCFQPVQLLGKVIDANTMMGIANAQVVARDVDGAAVSNVAVTGPDGSYKLTVAAPRDANGAPQSAIYTLRADAQGYLPFPSGIRVALPIDVKAAMGAKDMPLTLSTPTTTIALIPNGKTGLGRISGTVKSRTVPPGGTLVVAQGGATGIADRAGNFVVFNVEPGMKEVRGYISGVNLKPATVNVTANMDTSMVVLDEAGAANASVNGSVNIVNAPGGSQTSVVLVVDDTFNAALERGDVPKGLRAGGVTGAFSVKGVPDGRYAVLAAFENDGLVRDPDPNIAGTQIPHVTVAGGNVDAGNFKVTGALDVIAPGANAPEPVSGNPTFSWKDDSSETGYTLVVFDSFGNKIWENNMIPSSKGSNPSVPYMGPALMKGNFYQFRATSLKMGSPISRTEDLKGVFIAQ
jgi:hypothetical protein